MIVILVAPPPPPKNVCWEGRIREGGATQRNQFDSVRTSYCSEYNTGCF